MNVNRRTASMLVVILLTLPAAAFGWGRTGHEVVCEIAFQELEPVVRQEVGRLIHLDTEYGLFSTSCVWADVPRKREPDHYINVPRGHSAITVDVCPLADTCLFPAIDKDLEILGGTLSDDAEKLDALKFVGHWVGDIHQPFHVSFQDDRGANSVNVRGLCEGNLHGTWDGCIIARELGDDSRAIADRLLGEITDRDRAAWKYDVPVEWANESFQLSISKNMGYCVQQSGACWYEPDNMMLSKGENRRVMPIDQDYIDRHLPTIELRLKQAGVRLAAVLNEALR